MNQDDDPNRPDPEGDPVGDADDPNRADPGGDPVEDAEAPGPDPEGRRRAGRYANGLATFVLLLGVVAGLGGVVLVIDQLTQPGGSVTVSVRDAGELGIEGPDGLPDDTALDVTDALDDVRLEVAELPAWLRAITRAEALVGGLLFLVGAILLRRVLVEVAQGRPFAPVVPGRLTGLALTILALAVLPGSVDSLATVLVLAHLGETGPDSPLGFTIFAIDLVPVLVAVLIGVASRVVQHGQRLTTEMEGLV